MSSEQAEKQTAAEETRPARKLKELLALEARGTLDGLTDEEVRELTAFHAFDAKVKAEQAATATIEAVQQQLQAQIFEAQQQATERIAALAREGILSNFHEALASVDAQAAEELANTVDIDAVEIENDAEAANG